jgi:1-acyl-sn-glycerol-3-phosphate acyltransferase
MLAWRNWNFRTWARIVLRLLNVSINANGPGPCGPFLLVSNHLSYIDIVVLASQVDCAFIAKREVATWPFIGQLATWFDTVYINRSRKKDLIVTMNKMHRLIDSGLGVVLFAEGTSTSGQQVSRFRSGTLELAARHQVPVHYASISYATKCEERSADQSVCWWGDMTFPDHFLQMLQLSGFEVTLTFGRGPIVEQDRHVLASKLWHAVNAQFIPVPAHR